MTVSRTKSSERRRVNMVVPRHEQADIDYKSGKGRENPKKEARCLASLAKDG